MGIYHDLLPVAAETVLTLHFGIPDNLNDHQVPYREEGKLMRPLAGETIRVEVYPVPDDPAMVSVIHVTVPCNFLSAGKPQKTRRMVLFSVDPYDSRHTTYGAPQYVLDVGLAATKIYERLFKGVLIHENTIVR